MLASIPTRIISTLPSRHTTRKALDCNALSQRNQRGQQPLYAPRPVLGRHYCRPELSGWRGAQIQRAAVQTQAQAAERTSALRGPGAHLCSFASSEISCPAAVVTSLPAPSTVWHALRKAVAPKRITRPVKAIVRCLRMEIRTLPPRLCQRDLTIMQNRVRQCGCKTV